MSKQCTAALNCYIAKALPVKYISAHSSQAVACSQTRFVNLLSAKVLNAPISGMPYFQPLGLDGIGGEYQLLMEQALIPGGQPCVTSPYIFLTNTPYISLSCTVCDREIWRICEIHKEFYKAT